MPGRNAGPEDAGVDIPETNYATAPDGTAIAYQVIGEGPTDLVYAHGLWSNVELMWELPEWARFLKRLASFSRLILFDMRGVGLSDRGPERPTIELQRDDIAVVMDDSGSDSAILLGHARAASMAMVFAATHPERTKGLVLYSPVAKFVATPAFPHGGTEEAVEALLERLVRDVGTGRNLEVLAPSIADDERCVRWWGRFERLVASPGAFREMQYVLADIDVRSVLSAIHVPTLVLRRPLETMTIMEQARDVADRIDGAVYVELPGSDYLAFVGEPDAVLDEIEEFVTGVRPTPEVTRVLATLVFTDIVGSTEKQALLGDHEWKKLLERHHAQVREQVTRFRGEEQDTAGDGFYLRFDGPARAIACARAIIESVGRLGLEVRAGVHTGECELVEGKCAGLSVSIGARVMSLAGPSEVLVSQTVKDLSAGSGLSFEEAGEHELKGVPEPWHLYRVAG